MGWPHASQVCCDSSNKLQLANFFAISVFRYHFLHYFSPIPWRFSDALSVTKYHKNNSFLILKILPLRSCTLQRCCDRTIFFSLKELQRKFGQSFFYFSSSSYNSPPVKTWTSRRFPGLFNKAAWRSQFTPKVWKTWSFDWCLLKLK